MSTMQMALSREVVLTTNQRLHWAVKARHTRAIRIRAHSAAVSRFVFIRPLPRTHLTITIAFPDRRRRDVHNWMPTAKAAVDGLVDAGIWPDDSTDYLVGPDLRVDPETCPRGQIRLTFHFEPLEDS